MLKEQSRKRQPWPLTEWSDLKRILRRGHYALGHTHFPTVGQAYESVDYLPKTTLYTAYTAIPCSDDANRTVFRHLRLCPCRVVQRHARFARIIARQSLGGATSSSTDDGYNQRHTPHFHEIGHHSRPFRTKISLPGTSDNSTTPHRDLCF